MVESVAERGLTYIIVMRHGERADFVQGGQEKQLPYDTDIEHDPPLTAVGLD